MSKLKLSENLFLEVAELKRLVTFLEDDGYKLAVKSLVKSFGVVRDKTNSYFKPSLKVGSPEVVVINSGLAFDSNLNAIIMTEAKELSLTNSGINKWIVLSRETTNQEKGTVDVDTDGLMTGINTKFTEVLRGQPNFPVKVKLASEFNSGEYEVVKVVSDNSAILSGNLIQEKGLKYSVVGTFTPGFTPLDENKQIYEYDSYKLEVIDSKDKPQLDENKFIIAGASFDSNQVLHITDERIYSMYNEPYEKLGSTTTGEVDANNPLVSLLNVSAIDGGNTLGGNSTTLEMIVEHGYTISEYELDVTANNNEFKILKGKSNFFGEGSVPNDTFTGWLLVNRKNMKYVTIDRSLNKSLYIYSLDSSLIEESGNDFVIVPNFPEIEYEVTASSNVNLPTIPFYHRMSIFNPFARINLHSYLPTEGSNYNDVITITIKYRLVDSGTKQYPFKNLAIAQFTNYKGISETLAKSSYEVDLTILKPQTTQRNYS